MLLDHGRARLRERIIALAKEYGRYGYRTVMDVLRNEGWDVGKNGVYTIWRQEGLHAAEATEASAPPAPEILQLTS